MPRNRLLTSAAVLAGGAMALATLTAVGAPGDNLTGAVYTTDSTKLVDVNLYDAKEDVYLTGGPIGHTGGSDLPDGEYYVQVVAPGGTLLGSTIHDGTPYTVTVASGEFLDPAGNPGNLFDLVYSTSSGYLVVGYDDTDNAGGEYKVEVSPNADFSPRKSDNFKVEEGGGVVNGLVTIRKFFDANVNGIFDAGDTLLEGWAVDSDYDGGTTYYTSVLGLELPAPNTYTFTERQSVIGNWIPTTDTQVVVELHENGSASILFGNVCLGDGGGLTLGFWSNRNGSSQMNDGGTQAPELALLNGLHLANATGNQGDFANYSAFRTWILNATATNMAYMLSAQLAAMELNVEAGFVSGSSLVYAPGCGDTGVGNNFITITNLMAAAEAALTADQYTPADDAHRALQECLKDALDDANNNLNFVHGVDDCEFGF